MSLPTIKGIQPPPEYDLGLLQQQFPDLSRWLRLLAGATAKISTYSPTIDPGAVPAGGELESTFTVTGLKVNDVVFVNKPSNTAGIGIINAYVSAKDTLAIKFINTSGGSVNPPSETYRVVAVRL